MDSLVLTGNSRLATKIGFGTAVISWRRSLLGVKRTPRALSANGAGGGLGGEEYFGGEGGLGGTHDGFGGGLGGGLGGLGGGDGTLGGVLGTLTSLATLVLARIVKLSMYDSTGSFIPL